LARQPILDRAGKAHGYELLFRRGPEHEFHGDAEAATRIMIDNAIVFGLRKLTGGPTAFVNCTADSLIQRHVWILPPGMAVLEIPSTVEPSSGLIAACRELKAAGYKLALDNFVYRPALKHLIQLADYIKIDFKNTPKPERIKLLNFFKSYDNILIAEKLETQADFEEARAEGFTLFQGYYFCRPILTGKRPLPVNRMAHLHLLRLLEEETLDIEKVSEQVKLDPSLAYRLLRFVNSPLCAIREEVRSIPAALMFVGENMFRRFARLAILSEVNAGGSDELLRTAFVHARFCELAAEWLRFDPQEQYLMGLFSLLSAMLQMPMEDAIIELPLRLEICEALVGAPSRLRSALDWLECHERLDEEGAAQIAAEFGVDPEKLQECFTQAALWADEILWTASGGRISLA
jgi:EAL and modified HD-GYP domain-containing signal transduction protein